MHLVTVSMLGSVWICTLCCGTVLLAQPTVFSCSRWHHLRYQLPSPRVIFASLLISAAFFFFSLLLDVLWVLSTPLFSLVSRGLHRHSYHMLCHFVNLLIRKYDLCQFWPSGDVHLPGGLLGGCSEGCCACGDVHMVEDWVQGWGQWGKMGCRRIWRGVVTVACSKGAWHVCVLQSRWVVSVGHRFQYNKVGFGDNPMIYLRGGWYHRR